VRRPSSRQRNVAPEGDTPLTSVERQPLRWREARRLRWRLAWMRTRDRWEDVSRSVVQLVLGTWMVLEARQLRLTQRYFAMQTEPSDGRTTTKG
jgi:hypothetical protein